MVYCGGFLSANWMKKNFLSLTWAEKNILKALYARKILVFEEITWMVPWRLDWFRIISIFMLRTYDT